jgi:hypothetical protein
MADPDSDGLDDLEQRREATKELRRCCDEVGASRDRGIEVGGRWWSENEIRRRVWFCISEAADQVGLGDEFAAVNGRYGEADFSARVTALVDQIIAVAPMAAERGRVLDARLYGLCFTLRHAAPAAEGAPAE